MAIIIVSCLVEYLTDISGPDILSVIIAVLHSPYYDLVQIAVGP